MRVFARCVAASMLVALVGGCSPHRAGEARDSVVGEYMELRSRANQIEIQLMIAGSAPVKDPGALQQELQRNKQRTAELLAKYPSLPQQVDVRAARGTLIFEENQRKEREIEAEREKASKELQLRVEEEREIARSKARARQALESRLHLRLFEKSKLAVEAAEKWTRDLGFAAAGVNCSEGGFFGPDFYCTVRCEPARLINLECTIGVFSDQCRASK